MTQFLVPLIVITYFTLVIIIVELLNNKNKYDMKQDTPEEETLAKIKFCLENNNNTQAIRLLEQYGEWKTEQNKNKFKDRYDIGFHNGFKHAEEVMYSDEDMKYAFDSGRVRLTFDKERPFVFKNYEEFIEQSKNK